MSEHRRQARILAMQALCQWDVQKDESNAMMSSLLKSMEAASDAAELATPLVKTFWAKRREIDGRISAASDRWDLSRISPVERNVMRVALVEIFENQLAPAVAINEAIEIVREYGGADSPRFIHGVLDAVMRAGREQEPPG